VWRQGDSHDGDVGGEIGSLVGTLRTSVLRAEGSTELSYFRLKIHFVTSFFTRMQSYRVVFLFRNFQLMEGIHHIGFYMVDRCCH